MPALNTVSPSSVNAGSPDTTVQLDGSNFIAQSVAQVGAINLATTFQSSTQLRAIIPASLLTTAGPLSITVFTPAPGGGASAARMLTVLIVVQISPGAASITTAETQQFTATVIGTANTAVSWSIEGAGAGNPTLGTISSSGLYTPPIALPDPAAVTVRATSAADALRFANAAVNLSSPLEDWPKYRRDLSNTGRSLESAISSRNVARLDVKWQFDTGAKISASPAVATVGGIRTVYIGNWAGDLVAVNADTGAQRWRFTIEKVGAVCTTTARCRIASSPAVATGIVYFGTETGHVYALNASTGALVWRRQLGDPDQGYEIWSSPAVHNG
ncbi:MAG: PQQ-binding-like beta-propeller repeat protein, partial [Candidatus Acidiferrales bacterium]